MPTEETCNTCRFANDPPTRPECTVCLHRAFEDGKPYTGWTPAKPAPAPPPRPRLPAGWHAVGVTVYRAPSAWISPTEAALDDVFGAAEFLEIIRAAVHVGLVAADAVREAIKP